MALTEQERAELAALKGQVSKTSKLSDVERAELAALKGQVGNQPARDQVLDEMHPSIDFKTRLIYKNLGADPDASFKFLQKKNPELEWKRDVNGDPIARGKGETAWKKLDPSGFDLQDVSDIGYDVAGGVAQGVATTAGAVAGLPFGGLGAIPGAMGASAASGLGIEGLRQGLGAAFMGDSDNFSGSDLALTGLTSAASPLLFGGGVSAKQALKESFKQGATKTAKELLESQRGLLGRGYDAAAGKVGPKLANLLGGYDEDVIRAASDNLDLIKAAKANPEAGNKVIKEGTEKIVSGIQGSLSDTGFKIEDLTKQLDSQGAVIPTAQILEPINALKERLKSTGIQSDERKALIARLERIVDDNFTVKTKIEPELSIDQRLALAAGKAPTEKIPETVTKKTMPEFLTPTQANEAYFALKGISQDSGVDLSKLGQLKSIISSGSMNDMRVARAFNQATKKAKDAIKDVAEQAGRGEEYNALNADYSELKNFQNLFNNATKDESSYQRFLNKRGTAAEAAKQKVSGMIGEDVNKLGQKMQALDLFVKPQWEIPSFAMSNTGRTAGATAIGGGLGYMYGKELDDGRTFMPTMIGAGLGRYGAGPVMVKKYMQMNDIARKIPQAQGANFLPYTLMNTIKNDQEKDK